MNSVFKSIVFISITVAGTLSLNTSYAAETAQSSAVKIGVLDVQQVIGKSSQAAQLNKQLKEKFKPRQEKIIAAQKNIQAEMANFSKNQAIMKESDKNTLKNKIIADQNAYESTVQSFQKDVNNFQSQGMKKFMGSLENAVNTIAKKDHYTLILNRSAVPYAAPESDITQQTLDILNH